MNDSDSLAERLRQWEVLLNTSRPLLDELPQLAESHGQLTALVEDVKAHADREQTLRGQASMSVARRTELEGSARAARAKVVAILRGHFGTQNERLLEFGIPLGKTSRRAKVASAKPAGAAEGPPPPTA